MPDFLPRTDAEILAWVQTALNYANAHLAAVGLVAGDTAPITALLATANASFTANNAAQAAAQSTRVQKDADIAALVEAVRALVRKMQASGAVDNAEAAAMGLNVRDLIRTPVGAPTTAPVGTVDTSNRLRHILNFRDSASAAPRGKPDGVLGCEIWVKIGGTPPTDGSECQYLATDTRTPFTHDFDGADAGKTAYYLLRWVSTRHEPGPWSETLAATITG